MTDEWAAFRTQPAPAPAVDEWAAFRTEQPPSSSARSSAAADIAKSTGVGVAEGLIGSAGFLGDANDLIGRGTGWLLEKVAGADATPAQLEQIEAARRGPLALLSPKTSADIRKPIEAVTGEFYQPQTTAGEYARTIGAFAPSAALGSGRIVPRIVGDVLMPAIMSETAGQLTAGTAAEPYARAAGGLAGNVAVTGARAYANADNAMAAQAARGVTDAEYQAAQRLQDTAARIGVPLSGPEAIQEATRGATKLADLQRVVEGSQSGGQVTSRFYASRPEQVATATRSALDAIAPASPNPSTLGPRAASVAQDALDEARRRINETTRPYYRAAEGHVIDSADFEPIARDPAFQASLRRLRSDEVLGPTFRDQPDNSIAIVDAVTKDMRDRGVALGNAANPGFSSQTAGIYGAGAEEARDIARTPARGGSQAYDDALTMQEQARRQNLEPLEQGPLGRIAAARTTPAAYGELLPSQPLTGGADEIVTAIMRMSERDADLPASLVRQNLGDSFDQASRRIATGENQSAGGRFANSVAGTPEQRVMMDAILDAINRPAAREQVTDLMDVLRATSQRRPMGSPTEPNRMVNESLDRVTVPVAMAAAPASAGSTVFGEIRDRVRLAARDRAHNQLAELFTSPDSVQRIRDLGSRGVEGPWNSMLARHLVQTPMNLSANGH